ncbi:hypothetical protein P4S72_20230 [Vibrio sp. PP-XX7]
MKFIKTQLLAIAAIAAIFGASSAFASNTQAASAGFYSQGDSGVDIYKHESAICRSRECE